ncbi:hypothetical protein EON63_23265 [archaeon]|nr:MAG: hypothetical protein EON63_23265 [archaeon]
MPAHRKAFPYPYLQLIYIPMPILIIIYVTLPPHYNSSRLRSVGLWTRWCRSCSTRSPCCSSSSKKPRSSGYGYHYGGGYGYGMMVR